MKDTYGIYTLYSSSSGNCSCFFYGEHGILIDAGGSYKKLCAALSSLGHDISEIDAVFITHAHSDHISALEAINKNTNIEIHITSETALGAGLEKLSHTVLHERNYSVNIGDFCVCSFPTPHDSVGSVGYTVFTPAFKSALATDIGYMTPEILSHLCNCDSVIIESNYDCNMLACGHYPEFLKRRILSSSGHLSNDDCAAVLPYLAHNGVKRFLLAHLSKENNTPQSALNSAKASLLPFGKDIFVDVADRISPTKLI